MMRRQSGTTTVEFAIISVLAMLTLLGVIEVARLFFVSNMLAEVTRRGARVAVVCPINDPKIIQAAMFRADSASSGTPIYGLTESDLVVEYLDDVGTTLTGDLSDPANYIQIAYVRVSVRNYRHQLAIWGHAPFSMPDRRTTLPRESLGVPRNGAAPTCT